MSRFWVHHLQRPHFPSASLPSGKTWNEGPGENTIHHLPLCPADLGPKDAIVELRGGDDGASLTGFAFSECVTFFVQIGLLSVLLFGFCLCMITIKWEPLGLIERERELVHTYMQYRRINSLFIWIWHHIFVYISGVHCPWTAYAHFSMALPFCIYKL